MSVESGFKTFRGNDGLWENYPVDQVASHEGWLADPTLVTNFYNMLRRKLYAAQPGDGSLERPFIVFFGESVPMISVAAEAAEQADIFVIIGTSLNVYPAAGLIHYVRPSVPVYLIDPEPSMGVGRQNFKHFQCGASEGMKLLCEELC